ADREFIIRQEVLYLEQFLNPSGRSLEPVVVAECRLLTEIGDKAFGKGIVVKPIELVGLVSLARIDRQALGNTGDQLVEFNISGANRLSLNDDLLNALKPFTGLRQLSLSFANKVITIPGGAFHRSTQLQSVQFNTANYHVLEIK